MFGTGTQKYKERGITIFRSCLALLDFLIFPKHFADDCRIEKLNQILLKNQSLFQPILIREQITHTHKDR